MARFELVIDRLSKSGDGVAQHRGRAVFVEGVLPTERALLEVDESAKVLRGEVIEVLTQSPHRRTPPCPKADTCGGCSWQHIGDGAQLDFKQQIVVSTLAHLAHLEPGQYELKAPLASPRPLGYRRRAVFHPVNGRLGFFGRRSHTRVEIDHCPALTEPLANLPRLVSDALGPAALKDVDEVHLLECEGRVALSMHLQGAPRARHRDVLQQLVRDGQVDGAVLQPAHGKGGAEVFGAATLEEDGVFYRPEGFSQANAAVNRSLVSQAVEWLEVGLGTSVLELYAGNGNFTFRLAEQGAQVVAVESSALAMQLAQEAIRRRRIDGVRLMQGDSAKVAEGLVREGKRFDRLLVDPPRTGAPGVSKWASRLLVERLVYVACDPAALARDAGELMKAGYQPLALRVFDLFPQTHHIETVMTFARG